MNTLVLGLVIDLIDLLVLDYLGSLWMPISENVPLFKFDRLRPSDCYMAIQVSSHDHVSNKLVSSRWTMGHRPTISSRMVWCAVGLWCYRYSIVVLRCNGLYGYGHVFLAVIMCYPYNL